MNIWKRVLVVGILVLFSTSSAMAAPSRSKLYAMIQDLQALTATMQITIDAQQATIATLNNQLSSIEANPVLDLGEFVSVNTGEMNGVKGPNVIFEGVNLHLRSGSGFTEEKGYNAPLSGLGNFIIGYDELPDGGLNSGDRAGSHNFVIGIENKFSSYVGLVHGENNWVMDENSATIAGHANQVPGEYAVVVGGHYNTARGTETVVVGGDRNIADGTLTLVAGGYQNQTVEAPERYRWMSVFGGSGNIATGEAASVNGGQANSANGNYSTVSGGVETTVTEAYGVESGTVQTTLDSLTAQLSAVEGRVAVNEHQIGDAFSVLDGADFNLLRQLAPYVTVDQNVINGVAGPHVIFEGVNLHVQSGSGATNGTPNGLGNLLIGYDEAPDVLLEGDRGGSHNLIMGREHKFLSNDSILHGWGSTANAHAVAIFGGDGTVVNSSYSVAAGGMNNTINSHGVILGGEYNVIDGNYSVIVGGQSNRTSGLRATVTGGHSNLASGNYSSVSGGTEVQAVNDYSWAAGLLSQ